MPEETSFLAPGPLPLIAPDFHIISALGRVGDGLVYAARDGLRQARLREYAPPGVTRRGFGGALYPVDERFTAAWQAGVARFLAQGAELASISHPGIASVWRTAAGQVGVDRHGGYLIGAPFGEPLSAALAGGLALRPDAVMRLANDLAAALAEVHHRGLTHLDISPATVSIASGVVQLTDFAVDNRQFLPLLETQQGLVRPGYSPIELHEPRPEPLGPPTDVYAAAALVFRLITGRDPAPWQDRWRDPSDSELPDSDAWPPAFLAAIRKAMAIEPEDRFTDAGQWLDAMGPAPAAPAATAAAVTLDKPSTPELQPADPPLAATPISVAPPAPPPPLPRRKGNMLAPLLILAIVLLGALVGGLYAWQEGWFDRQEDEPTANKSGEPPRRETPRRAERPARGALEPGGTVSGQLTERDERRSGGQYQDSFTLAGRAGQRVELRLSSGDFDPLVTITGPGFQASNDDDAEQGSLNSRLEVTLPRNGTYTITATSYTPGATGTYLLEVLEPGPAPAVVAPAMLDGRWRVASDMQCGDPLAIRVEGADVIVEHKGRESRGRALDGIGSVIRVRMDGGPPEGADLAFLMAEDGESFSHDGETWVRC